MTTVFKDDQSEVYTYYIVTCLTAPSLGVLLSILVFNFAGGYNSRAAYGLCLLFGSLAVVAGIPVPFATRCTVVYVLLWLIFFFGSVVLAPLVGMMLNQVRQPSRATANSVATLCYNFFGYFPAPFVFGGVADSDKSDPIGSMRYAMGTITYWSILAVMFMLVAILIKFKRGDKDGEDEFADSVQSGDYNRLCKSAAIDRQVAGLPVVLDAEEALSSHIGDSQVSLTNQNNSLVRVSPMNAGMGERRSTNLTANSDSS